LAATPLARIAPIMAALTPVLRNALAGKAWLMA